MDLLDHRRRVSELYRRVRSTPDPLAAWERWVEDRQLLIASHPESPWEPTQRAGRGLRYFPYDHAWRFEVDVEQADGPTRTLDHSSHGTTASTPLGEVIIRNGGAHRLVVRWLRGHGGGLFLPFGDRTNGTTTHAGGRYLLDTARGADFGGTTERLVLDFHFAHHPSCVHSPRWSSPLPPAENRHAIAVEAGERLS